MTPIFTLATTLSNQQNRLLTMVQVLYLLEVFILAHYRPPSTETPTTETAVVRCHKNNWIYLTSTYYWWLLRPTITIQFEISNNSLTIRYDSKWKKNTICTALDTTHYQWDKLPTNATITRRWMHQLGLYHRLRNHGGNGGTRPRNAETAQAKVYFRPRDNLPSLSAGW